MTKYHKFQQKGVGDLRGGRNENLTHDDRHLTTSNNRLGGSMQTPPLPSYNQVDLQQQPKGSPPSTPLSLMWQKEPANEKEKNVAMGQSLQPEKPKVKDVQTPLIQELVDFSLFENDHECPSKIFKILFFLKENKKKIIYIYIYIYTLFFTFFAFFTLF